MTEPGIILRKPELLLRVCLTDNQTIEVKTKDYGIEELEGHVLYVNKSGICSIDAVDEYDEPCKFSFKISQYVGHVILNFNSVRRSSTAAVARARGL